MCSLYSHLCVLTCIGVVTTTRYANVEQGNTAITMATRIKNPCTLYMRCESSLKRVQ
jgi:hypothetical protein